MGAKWTNGEDALIRELKDSGATWGEIAERLTLCGTPRSKDAVKGHARKMGITAQHEPYTAEQDIWLAENYADYANYDEVARAFNEVFKTSKTGRGIQSHVVRYLRLMSGRQGFEKGMNTHNSRPVGDEYVGTLGYTYVKVSNTGEKNKDWVAKQRVVYEQAYGEIPEGYEVCFVDGDKTNFDTGNLVAIDRKVSIDMVRMGWYGNGTDFTKVALQVCELRRVIDETKKRAKA